MKVKIFLKKFLTINLICMIILSLLSCKYSYATETSSMIAGKVKSDNDGNYVVVGNESTKIDKKNEVTEYITYDDSYGCISLYNDLDGYGAFKDGVTPHEKNSKGYEIIKNNPTDPVTSSEITSAFPYNKFGWKNSDSEYHVVTFQKFKCYQYQNENGSSGAYLWFKSDENADKDENVKCIAIITGSSPKYYYEITHKTYTNEDEWNDAMDEAQTNNDINAGEVDEISTINDEGENDDSDLGGVLLGPIISFINTLADGLQSLITSCMRPNYGWKSILVGKNIAKVTDVPNRVKVEENGDNFYTVFWMFNDETILHVVTSENKISGWPQGYGGTNTEEAYQSENDYVSGDSVNDNDAVTADGDYYIDATGYKRSYAYPQIAYSPEEIFAGKVDLLNANFFTDSTDDSSAINTIKGVIQYWFRALRYLGLAGLLAVLVYTGIKIMTSSIAQDKAKYKALVANWVIAILLMFLLPYIMSFTFNVSERLTKLFTGSSDNKITVWVYDGLAGNSSSWGSSLFSHGNKYTYTKMQTNLMGLARFQVQSRNVVKMIGYEIIYIMLIVFTIRFTIIYLRRLLYVAFLTMISPIVVLMYPIDKAGDGQSQSFQMWLKEYIFNALLQPLHMLLYYVFVTSAISFASQNFIYVLIVLGFMTQAEQIMKQIFGFGKAGMGTVGGLAGSAGTVMSLSALTSTANNVSNMLGISNKSKTKQAPQQQTNKGDEDMLANPDYETFASEDNNSSETKPIRENSTQREKEQRLQDLESRRADLNDEERQEYNKLSSEAAENDWFKRKLPDEDNEQLNLNIPEYNPINNNLPTEPIQKDNSKLNGPKTTGQALKRMATRRTQKLRLKAPSYVKGGLKFTGKLAAGALIGSTAVLAEAAISLAANGKYNPLEGVGTFVGATIGGGKLVGMGARKISNIGEEFKQTKLGDEEYARQKRAKDFITNRENINKYIEQYGDKGRHAVAYELARGAQYAEQGITNAEDQFELAKYEDSLADDEYNAIFSGMEKSDIEELAQIIRAEAEDKGDKSMRYISAEETIKRRLKTAGEEGRTLRDVVVNTKKAKDDIGESIINGGKKKQEAYIESNARNPEEANQIRTAIRSVNQMDAVVKKRKKTTPKYVEIQASTPEAKRKATRQRAERALNIPTSSNQKTPKTSRDK